MTLDKPYFVNPNMLFRVLLIAKLQKIVHFSHRTVSCHKKYITSSMLSHSSHTFIKICFPYTVLFYKEAPSKRGNDFDERFTLYAFINFEFLKRAKMFKFSVKKRKLPILLVT